MIATINDSNDSRYAIAIISPFSADFVNDLKDEIHYEDRKWGGKGTGWLVSAESVETAIEVASRYYQVMDARIASDIEIEDAKIDAEIVEIEKNQKFILEHEEEIKAEIKALDEFASRFSFRSKSRRKAAAIRKSYLFAHALDNARMDIAQMTELHVRGLAAAVREFCGD